MSEENQSAKRTIEVDTEFLESLYGLVGKIPPGEKGINVDLLKDLILDIKRKMEKIKTEALQEASAPKARKSDNIQAADEMQEEIANEKAVLIVDDLGVITYQLGVMFRNLGYDVTIAKEIYDAITKYKKQMFKLVIMDLFIPTDREGFLLLDELVKLSKMNDCQTVIGVEDWQQELIDYCEKN